MNYTFFIAGTIILFLVAYGLKKIEESQKNKEKEDNEFVDDLNDSFFKNSHGENAIELVKIFNPYDRVVIRSILKSEGIETYVKSNIFGELYPTYDIHNFSTSVVMIYENDKEQAKEIVKDYLLTLDKKNYPLNRNKMGQTTTALMGVPPTLSKFKPELLV